MKIINSNYQSNSFTGLEMKSSTIKALYDVHVSDKNKARFAKKLAKIEGDYSLNYYFAAPKGAKQPEVSNLVEDTVHRDANLPKAYFLFSITKTEDLAPKNIDTKGELYRHNIFLEAVDAKDLNKNDWNKFFKKVIKTCLKSDKK